MITPGEGPVSAARLAEELGDALAPAGAIPEESFTLVARVRELVAAVVMTDIGPEGRAAATRGISAITEVLRSRQRDQPLFLVRHPDGRVESLVQAGSGRLNPQAPPLEWTVRPTEPPPGTEPVSVEVRCRCTFNAAHGGSPGRVHGGVLALVLDEVLGVATRAAGAGGMTVALSVSFKGATPVDVPVEISGRFTGSDGRKSFAAGEVTVGGVLSAEASGVYVQERRDG